MSFLTRRWVLLFKTLSASVYGIDAEIVEIEVDLKPRTGDSAYDSCVTVVGLPDPAVRESRERIRAAISNCGFYFPARRTTINLAPADVKKEGSLFDLPIATGILGANELLSEGDVAGTMLVGELALSGGVRPIRGALPIAIAAKKRGVKRLILPAVNALEASVVRGIDVYAANSLDEVVSILQAQPPHSPLSPPLSLMPQETNGIRPDFKEVCGQLHVKRALEVATAGAHNVLDGWATWFGKDDACQTHPVDTSTNNFRRSPGDYKDSQRGRAHQGAGSSFGASIPLAASYNL